MKKKSKTNNYFSNTLAGGGNQFVFTNPWYKSGNVSRIFYKVSAGGEYDYVTKWSCVMDSTFSDGSVSRANTVLEGYYVLSLKMAVVKEVNNEIPDDAFIKATFSGENGASVSGENIVVSDPVKLSAKEDEYICLEIEFNGKTIPYHEECLIPTFVKFAGEWVPDRRTPIPMTLACDRTIIKRIGFWGDSITQGIGVKLNSYNGYSQVAGKLLASENGVWNLGLGYGRLEDASSLSAWYNKAILCDLLIICFGVNDISNGATYKEIKKDLKTLLKALKKRKIKVLLQTVPPFDFEKKKAKVRDKVNDYILNKCTNKWVTVFDNRFVLAREEEPQTAIYVGHPNETGCKLWGEKIYEAIKELL